MLNCVRVHSKVPGGKSDFDNPIVLPKGGTLLAVAESIHKDWARKLKCTLVEIWKVRWAAYWTAIHSFRGEM